MFLIKNGINEIKYVCFLKIIQVTKICDYATEKNMQLRFFVIMRSLKKSHTIKPLDC